MRESGVTPDITYGSLACKLRPLLYNLRCGPEVNFKMIAATEIGSSPYLSSLL